MNNENFNPAYRAAAAWKYLGIGKSLFYELVKQGKLKPPIKLSERTSAWLKSDLDEFLADRAKASRLAGKRG